ncbi:hypothetical protein ACVGWG_06045, partial [Enterobacter asburiae]
PWAALASAASPSPMESQPSPVKSIKRIKYAWVFKLWARAFLTGAVFFAHLAFAVITMVPVVFPRANFKRTFALGICHALPIIIYPKKNITIPTNQVILK